MRYFIYLISIVLITMVMIYIGIRKEKDIDKILTNKLYVKCSNKVMKYLNKNSFASLNDIQILIKGVTASIFWSRKKVKVENPSKFSKTLMNELYNKGKIAIEVKKNKTIYTIKESVKTL